MRILTYFLTILFFFSSCNSSSNDNDSDYYSESRNDEDYQDEEDYEEEGFRDGTYSATVDYYNPGTGYSATYTLDVEVEDNQVTVIYFPNDGYLDDDHIWSDELDSDGFVRIDGEEGKTYEVQIDF